MRTGEEEGKSNPNREDGGSGRRSRGVGPRIASRSGEMDPMRGFRNPGAEQGGGRDCGQGDAARSGDANDTIAGGTSARRHGVESTHQGDASEAFKAKEQTLVKSKPQFHHSPVNFELGETSEKGVGGSFSVRSASPRLPKTDFPKFDGDNPKLRKTNSEKYFEMYQVPYNSWSSFLLLCISLGMQPCGCKPMRPYILWKLGLSWL